MRRGLLHAVLAVGLLAVSTSGVGLGAVGDATNPCVGTIADRPAGTTLLTIQGVRGREKTPALLVSVAPDGSVVGVHNDTARGRWWSYDVDPLPSGRLLHATTETGITVVETIDPATGDLVTVKRFPMVLDAHDVDRIDDQELVMVDKGPKRNRVLVYNLTTERITWQWRFDRAYPRSGGGPYNSTDWTHVNDVDAVGDGFLLSVRNFDQVILLNRTTKQIEWRLGADDRMSTMSYQHNPAYLEGPDGNPVVLVADSVNDRVVEYERRNGNWTRTWELSGGGLDEPRDADRLPNGNTLVTDRVGQRILEVTPTGEIVWEFYAPWQPYDAERYLRGDEPAGPATSSMGTTGTYTMTNSAGFTQAEIEACSAFLTSYEAGGRLVPDAEIAQYGNATADTMVGEKSSVSGSSVQSDFRQSVMDLVPIDVGLATLLVVVLLGALVTGIAIWHRR